MQKPNLIQNTRRHGFSKAHKRRPKSVQPQPNSGGRELGRQRPIVARLGDRSKETVRGSTRQAPPVHPKPATRGEPAAEKNRFLVSLPFPAEPAQQWLSLPARGINARERVSRLAPPAERALILRAEELQAVLEYVDEGEDEAGQTLVCEVRMLIRLSAEDIMKTDGWTFREVSECFTFRPTSNRCRA